MKFVDFYSPLHRVTEITSRGETAIVFRVVLMKVNESCLKLYLLYDPMHLCVEWRLK